MSLTDRDRFRLKGVHPDLVRVVERAAQNTRFIVVEGVRTLERQKELFAAGKSKTMNSRHLPSAAKGCSTPVSHAVDLAPLVDLDGDGVMELSWHVSHFKPLALVMQDAADDFNVRIEWGGAWISFQDCPHWQLSRSFYP